MIVLAMLTGFNKIGSLERSGPRARQHCVFMNVSVCVCVCMHMHLREKPGINVCFCPANCYIFNFFCRLSVCTDT